MKNSEVAIAFIQGRHALGSNFKSENGKLYSYSSVLAEWRNGIIIVYEDIATFSNTSKRHWYYLRTQAQSYKLI